MKSKTPWQGWMAGAALGSVLGLNVALAAAPLKAEPAPPETPVRLVTDDYFGVKVDDPYRWMEDMGSAEFKDWAKAQAGHAEKLLATLPARNQLRQRLGELADAGDTLGGIEFAPGKLFYLKSEPGRNARRLFVREGIKGAETLLLDPESLGSAGSHWSIDFFTPSPDGKVVAVGLSLGGSENSEIRLLRQADQVWLKDVVPRAGLNEAGIAWRPDGKSFFYNRLPQRAANGKEERYTRSVLAEHVLGQDAVLDVAVFGFGVRQDMPFDVADVPVMFTAPGSRYALAVMHHGDSVDRSYYVAPVADVHGASAPWQRVAGPQDQASYGYLVRNDLYLLTHLNAPRYQLKRVRLGTANTTAVTLLPAGNLVLKDAAASRDALYVRALDGGVNRLFRVSTAGGAQKIALPFAGTLSEIAADSHSDAVLLKLENWTHPAQIFRLERGRKVQPTALLAMPKLSLADYTSTRVLVKSHDGVEVPLSLIHRKDVRLDGTNPTILTGYGAYGIVLEARFSAQRLAWLERGGVLAVAHVRGGGEFGEEWHQGAHILNKDNTIKDFIACAEYLVRTGYTSPRTLAGTGGSAGGVTIGGAITQRPELFAAAQSAVGLSDMLRMELTPNGPPNIAEFGTVKIQEQFEAMLRISPYHRVRDGERYPAVIVTTGINDPRVDAWEPAKFAARLQAASASGKPVLLRIDYDAGHGRGSTRSQQIAVTADVWSFFLWQMGVPGFQPLPPAR